MTVLWFLLAAVAVALVLDPGFRREVRNDFNKYQQFRKLMGWRR